MTRVRILAAVAQDFERIFDFVFERAPESATARIAAIVEALGILATSPMIGRPVPHGLRELVISSGASGYLALYRYKQIEDEVEVLAVRSQRERAYVARTASRKRKPA